MKLTVIISTYNSEEWLRKVLIGYSVQTERDFEIIVADDGSTSKTKELIESFHSRFKFPIVHVWQEDNGFQKPKILNKAILKSTTDYLIFSDGDCIPRKDFVANHLKYREEGFFLSGGYFKLPMNISNSILEEDIVSQNCFQTSWLIKNGLKINFKITKLINFRLLTHFMNWVTPTKRTWNGHNSSAYKKELLAINGFNQDMYYGGEDRELGERLYTNGLLSKQIRYSAVCLHLDHERGYVTKEGWERNDAIRKLNRKNKVTFISNGIHTFQE